MTIVEPVKYLTYEPSVLGEVILLALRRSSGSTEEKLRDGYDWRRDHLEVGQWHAEPTRELVGLRTTDVL